MAYLTGTNFGGEQWVPTFVQTIDPEKCIGCGRCFKTCARKVLGPFDLEDEETESIRMIMTIVNQGSCIGCASCGFSCPKKAFTLKPLEV